MSSGPVRRISREDIQLVQNLIERCLQLYMNRKEVLETLLVQAKIEPGFTELVWKKLEEENSEFFKAYYLRLKVKNQIMEFNKLLEQQVQLMHQIQTAGVTSAPTSNGSSITALHQNSACYAQDHRGPALKPGSMHHAVGSSLPDAFANGGSSLHQSMHCAVDISNHSSRMDAPPNMLSTDNSSMGLMQGINGGIVESNAAYSGNSTYMFGADRNIMEMRPIIGDASVASYSSVDSNSQSLNEPLLDAETSAFGFLGQIPRNFSLSDLTAGFSHSSDILENYSRSPFLGTDTENFLDTHDRELLQVDNRRLDTISEGLSYDDFGSE